MNFREMNLRVLQGLPVPQVFFQPRFEPWYAWHRTFNVMPEAYQQMSMQELFDDLQVSFRYIHYYTGVPDPVVTEYDPEVQIIGQGGNGEVDRIYRTPLGDMVEHLKLTVDQEWRTVGFPVKSVDDLRKLRWLHRHMRFSFSEAHFLTGSEFVGERGEPQFWVPKSPYQALAQIWMKLNDLVYALVDYREEVEETMRAIDEAYDPLYEQIIASGKVKILNFGENLHEALFSPRYFERYLIPFYEKRSNQLRQKGIFTHVHLDGYFKSLLRFLKGLPFDGLEALTPQPQGDVPLEEIKEYIGDKVLLDGIPAVMFMDTYSREELLEFTERVVKLFSPRLVLGVSDEVPEGTGQEAIERVRMISKWCRVNSPYLSDPEREGARG